MLDQMQILAGALVIGLRTEVRYIDHERIALPVAAGVAVPLADATRQVWTSVHDDVALPALTLADVVENRDAAGRLHDPTEAAGRGAEFRQSAGQAAIRQRAILRTIVPVHPRGVVAGRRLGEPWRGCRIVFSAAACH